MNKIKTILLLFVAMAIAIPTSASADPNTRSKFFDFGEMLIDGQVNRPQGYLYMARYEAKFGRLLRLKRDFMGRSINSAKSRVFK